MIFFPFGSTHPLRTKLSGWGFQPGVFLSCLRVDVSSPVVVPSPTRFSSGFQPAFLFPPLVIPQVELRLRQAGSGRPRGGSPVSGASSRTPLGVCGVLSRRFRLVPLLPSGPWNGNVPRGSWTGRPALFPIGSFGGILRLVLGVRITSVWFVKNLYVILII